MYTVMHRPKLELQDAAQLRFAKRAEHHRLIDAIHELRGEDPPRGVDSCLRHLAHPLFGGCRSVSRLADGGKSQFGTNNGLDFARARLLVRKIMVREKSTLRL